LSRTKQNASDRPRLAKEAQADERSAECESDKESSNEITMIGESPPAMKMAGARSAERRLEEPGKRAEFVRGAKARK
jgi:hypothetical protein